MNSLIDEERSLTLIAPGKTGSLFESELHYPLTCNAKHVALYDLSISNDVINIYNPINKITCETDGKFYDLKIPEKRYINNTELIHSINTCFRTLPKNIATSIIFIVDKFDICHITIKAECTLFINKTLSSILGFADRTLFSTGKVGDYSPGKVHAGENKMDLTLSFPKRLFIYMSHLKHQYYSNVALQLLRTIDITKFYKYFLHPTIVTVPIVINNPFYIPLENGVIRKFKIQLRGSTGDLLRINPASHIKTSLTCQLK
jgi:hypothetical protein